MRRLMAPMTAALLLATAAAVPAHAGSHERGMKDMKGMMKDHSTMGHGTMGQGSMNKDSMNHGSMNHGAMGEGVVPTSGVLNSRDGDTLNVTHEPIPQIGWPRMTMDLKLLPDAHVGAVSPGDNVMLKLKKGADGIYGVQGIMPKP